MNYEFYISVHMKNVFNLANSYFMQYYIYICMYKKLNK